MICGYAGSGEAVGDDVSNFIGDEDVWVFLVDGSGSLVWEKTFGGIRGERAYGIIPTLDGKHLLTGYTKSGDIGVSDNDVSNNNGDSLTTDWWLVKLQ